METNSPSPDTPGRHTEASQWRFPLLLIAVLVGIVLWKGNAPSDRQTASPVNSPTWTPSPRPSGETVGLEIDFGNGARRVFDALSYREDMTVADVLTAASEFRPGVSFSQVGEGKGGFLTALEGLKNEGADGRNWRYEVAGKPGTKSFCLQTVAAGDLVRWTFAGENENR